MTFVQVHCDPLRNNSHSSVREPILNSMPACELIEFLKDANAKNFLMATSRAKS